MQKEEEEDEELFLLAKKKKVLQKDLRLCALTFLFCSTSETEHQRKLLIRMQRNYLTLLRLIGVLRVSACREVE